MNDTTTLTAHTEYLGHRGAIDDLAALWNEPDLAGLDEYEREELRSEFWASVEGTLDGSAEVEYWERSDSDLYIEGTEEAQDVLLDAVRDAICAVR